MQFCNFQKYKWIFVNESLSQCYTVKPRFWNTSWSAANVFQNRGPHFGKKIGKVPWATIFILFYATIFWTA